MLRIFAGKHRGRKLQVFSDKQVRPTAGRTREAIFNILNHGRFAGEERFLDGCTVLDLFCGSGALGLEALSHGASHVVFIDISQECLAIAKQNAAHLGESGNITLLRSDSANPPTARFPCSLVFIDPPYGSNLMVPALKNLAARGWLKPGAIIVAEMEKKEDIPALDGFARIDERMYGRTRVILLEWGTSPEQS